MTRPRAFNAGFSAGFGIGPYHYELSPWSWVTAGEMSYWAQPSAVGMVDMRPIPAQEAKGGTPQGFAFVASPKSNGGIELAVAANFTQESATTTMEDAWQTAMSYRPQGATLVDLLWDQMTNGADPIGDAGPKPLMPTVRNRLELYLPGHSLVKSEGFAWGVHPHTNRVQAVLQNDFRRMWETSNGADYCRRALDFWCEQYRIEDWREFVPANLRAHVPGRLPHSTTITESFNQADSTTLGPDLSWSEAAGGWRTVSNHAGVDSNAGWNLARATTALSSADHYAQAVDITASYRGPGCRVPSNGDVTFYAATNGDSVVWMWKLVAGSQTGLTNSAQAFTTGDVFKIQANGSSITTFYNGTERDTVTDSAISGNLYCGIVQNGLGDESIDTFEAADLAAATGQPTVKRFGGVRFAHSLGRGVW